MAVAYGVVMGAGIVVSLMTMLVSVMAISALVFVSYVSCVLVFMSLQTDSARSHGIRF